MVMQRSPHVERKRWRNADWRRFRGAVVLWRRLCLGPKEDMPAMARRRCASRRTMKRGAWSSLPQRRISPAPNEVARLYTSRRPRTATVERAAASTKKFCSFQKGSPASRFATKGRA